jgi:hypothetical protein
MSKELIRPIDADTAHAIEEASKAASKAIEAAMRSGRYVGEVLGDLPHDLVGIIGDWVVHKRARRWAELQAKTEEILRERDVDNREEVSPSVAIPLIAAAINEDREVLKELWAKMLAAALDPERANLVRPVLIETLKKMDPLDAMALRAISAGIRLSPGNDLASSLTGILETSPDEARFAVEHLFELDCLAGHLDANPNPPLSARGRLLIAAVSD